MSATNPGQLVDGRYRLQSRLGTGGMADVYLAEDTQLERQVALKLLHRRFAEDPGFVERFRREAQSAANLQHPNVVAVYDRGSWDGTYYIAMEYLQGRTLKQVIRAEAPLDPLRAIDITVQMLKATRFAHRRGVIHRDLKPHNVMLDDQDHAKVTDFGIARAGASDMTETGSIMGTAQYLSPEQAQGLAVAEGSDLYSIGIVLYEMLTGHLPFDAESAVTIALKHVSEAPIPPARYNPGIPPALEQTVLWALNKDPADRPRDAEQFINVLEGIRESLSAGAGGQVTANMAALSAAGAAAGVEGVIGPRPRVQLGAAELTYPSTATHPIPGESGALLAVGPAVPVAGPPQDPERRSRWSRIWPWLLGLLVALAVAGGVVAFVLTRPKDATVPVVVGLSQQSATSAVERAGFNPQVIQQASTEPQGHVFFQHPLGTTKAAKGTTVDLTVSSGPGQTSVPAVVQLRQKQAIRELHLAGLKVSRVLTESSSTVPKNEVTRTDPDAGVSLQTGQSVVLYLSSGPAPILVPDVRGDTLATAQSTLSQFTVTHTTEPSSAAAPGTVSSQSPAGGAKELPGSTVSLVIAQKQPTVKLPKVTGQPDTTARATLTSLGLKVTTTLQTTSDQADDGVVISQSPVATSKVPEGSTVTLVVGRYSASTTTTSTTTSAPTTTTAPPAVTTTFSPPTTATTADQPGTTTAAPSA